MEQRSNLSPAPLQIEAVEPGIALRYLDGRTVQYSAPIRAVSDPVEASPIQEIHVLVTDAEQTEGIMVYVNDYDTSDAILESTGVGRILLDPGEEAAIYPGVIAARSQEQIRIDADGDAVDGGVYVFVEHQLTADAYQLVAP